MNLGLKHRRDESPEIEESSPPAESLSDFVPKEILPLKDPQTDIRELRKMFD